MPERVVPSGSDGLLNGLDRRARHSSASACLEQTTFSLHLEDCVQGVTRLESESVDLVVTSPPYNLGVRYSKFSDHADRADYLRWCKRWSTQIARVLKPNGSFFLNVGSTPANPMLPHELILELRDQFVLQNTIHWVKSITIEERNGSFLSRGHFKPIRSERFLHDSHEYIFHLTKTGCVKIERLALGVPYGDKTNIARWAHTEGQDRRCRGNIWFIPYATIQRREEERPHPATFPVELAENCIRLHGTSRAKTMLDPFVGIGTSAVAAKRSGVPKFIGFEIDEHYLRETKRRLSLA